MREQASSRGLNPLSNLEGMIYNLRGERVLLDSVVAELYGVPTQRVNESVVRNRGQLPKGYVLSLTAKEWRILKSQLATSMGGKKRSYGN